MKQLYNTNGLIFWNAEQIRQRRFLADQFAGKIYQQLLTTNLAWQIQEIEAPILTPSHLINSNYTKEDIYSLGSCELILRPETTPGTYTYMKSLLDSHSNIKLPICIWQMGKSFRREQDQVTKNVRLKEFYQQEFQCFYSADSKNNYFDSIVNSIEPIFKQILRTEIRLISSDRLPFYSQKTLDVECNTGDRWLELCSISLRQDFTGKAHISNKDIDILVVEIAIGLDRCLYILS